MKHKSPTDIIDVDYVVVTDANAPKEPKRAKSFAQAVADDVEEIEREAHGLFDKAEDIADGASRAYNAGKRLFTRAKPYIDRMNARAPILKR